MATKRKQEGDKDVSVLQISTSTITFAVLGTSPFICNAMSEKVRQDLLLPRGRKNAAEKAGSLKHNPLEEYRASAYKSVGAEAETRILMTTLAFKKALVTAALDMPGMMKTQLGRLTYVAGDYVSIYGIPQLLMSVVRNSDMNHTPDIRARAILREWACYVTLTYVQPILREQIVANLFAAAGIIRGVGDWRPEKGSGSYGQFQLVGATDPKFQSIITSGGREAQDAALETPSCYDAETEALYEWYRVESARRGFKAVA